jgi:hypothetical protein
MLVRLKGRLISEQDAQELQTDAEEPTEIHCAAHPRPGGGKRRTDMRAVVVAGFFAYHAVPTNGSDW